MKLVTDNLVCPKCGQSQPEGESCRSCGIIFRKYKAVPRNRPADGRVRQPRFQSRFPFTPVTRSLQIILLLSILIAGLSYLRKDSLPAADFYDLTLLTDPAQSATDSAPFEIHSNGIDYLIEPQFDYQLNGVVVSYHDSDSWWDIYHHRSWQDYVNIRDLCVVWGDNVASGVYREMDFKNSTWTCWASWPDRETGRRFRMHQLSNNHILVGDPQLNQAIMEAEPGDQISLSGMLASYSHSNGLFSRGTSTTRSDTGNGACETIYVEGFEILQKANPGWRSAYRWAWSAALLSLLGLTVLVFVSPVRRID